MENSEFNDTFEIISTFFVNEFYIKLYNAAVKSNRTKQSSSITSAYIDLLRIYQRTIENKPIVYKKKIRNLFSDFVKYYKGMGGNYELTVGYCIDLIVSQFVPSDYIESFSDENKHIILRSVIINIVKNITTNISNQYMHSIIDCRNDKEIIEILREDILNCINNERDRIQKQFIISENYGSDEKYRHMYNDLLKNIKTKISKYVKENCNLKNDLKKITSVHKISIKKIFELEKEIDKLRKIIAEKDNTVKYLTEDNNLKNNRIRNLQNDYSLNNFVTASKINLNNNKNKNKKHKKIKKKQLPSAQLTFNNIDSDNDNNDYSINNNNNNNSHFLHDLIRSLAGEMVSFHHRIKAHFGILEAM